MVGRFEQKRKKFSSICIAAVLLAVAACAFLLKKDTPETIELRIYDKVLIQITESETLEQMKDLLGGAQALGYMPKTFVLGPSLVYTGTDGTSVTLELDMDSDLFRYTGKFYDYGPGNDNNSLPQLIDLLGLDGWPEEVREAFPEWFASVEEGILPTVSYRQQAVYMDLWYPDWYYVKIREEQALVILEALRQEAPARLDREKVPVEQSVFTIHIAYDDGREYDLVCVGEKEFLLWEGGTEAVYGFFSTAFRENVDEMIALSKEK